MLPPGSDAEHVRNTNMPASGQMLPEAFSLFPENDPTRHFVIDRER